MILILGKDDAQENGENPVLMLYANVGLGQACKPVTFAWPGPV